MKYFSTFSGIGGFELGIGNHAECIGYSEIDKPAIKIYEYHFPKHKNYGNIRDISADALPDFDILCGGFPCQAFSIAGKRGGFDDTRGTLFFELARIAKAKRPRYLFFENVKGLLSHDGGRTFDTIIRTLDELGYGYQWQVLNSKDFGVPQNRERVFIIGHLRGTSRPEIFPVGQDGEENNELQGHHSNTLTARYEPAQATGTYIGESQFDAQVGTLRTHNDGKGFRRTQSGLSPTLPARAREDGSGQVIVALVEKRSDEAKRIRRESWKKGKDFSPRREKKLVPREDGKIGTITSSRNNDNLLLMNENRKRKKSISIHRIRRLTVTECERLQGFPDGWTKGVSDSQRYKMLGNAVTVNVIKYIADHLFDK